MSKHPNSAALAAVAMLMAGAAPTLALAQDSSGSIGTKAPVPVTGQQVYVVVCQSCHMADGKGGVGAGQIPALANNPRLAGAAYPITMVLKGRGAMPWFDDVLTPAQLAGVVGYIRTSFGNSYAAPVTEADVKALWAVTKGH